MISGLTRNERLTAAFLAIFVVLIGITMAAAARQGPMVVHGFMAAALGLAIAVAAGAGSLQADPPAERLKHYYDEPIKFGIAMSIAWAVVAMGTGVWVAALMYWPDLNFDVAWTSYGRIRPVHTTGVIFGFGGNALIATSFHVMQRTSRARMPDQLSPWIVLLGYNLFCLWAATGYMMGVTQSKEYAEAEWYADILLVIVWVQYLVLYIRTLARRAEPHIYVANWYFLAFIVVVAMLHIVNNLALPVSFAGTQSYPIFSGVQDAMVQWWYGHNAVAFFLTSGFLGMLYYYMPIRAQRPIYSYRLSIISFWGITFFYIWVGSHHLHYTALPQWVQTLGMTFSIMLLIPSWASAGNALMTLRGAYGKVRDDATLRFMFVAAIFYGLSTFEGSFMAIRAVNSLSHYTDWTIGHVHSGALGWVAMITFGAIYTLVPILWKREAMYSARLVEWHFWLAVSGTLIYVFALWNAGIVQGLMWRTYGQSGTLQYSFLQSMEAMHPYYLARTFGGALFLTGACVCAFNIFMTARHGRVIEASRDLPISPATVPAE